MRLCLLCTRRRIHTALAGAPREVTDLYHKHHSEMLDQGKSRDEAHAHGLRMIRLAGWFRGSGGKWSRLTPDLRKKVNIREAIEAYIESLKEDGLPVPEDKFEAVLVAV